MFFQRDVLAEMLDGDCHALSIVERPLVALFSKLLCGPGDIEPFRR